MCVVCVCEFRRGHIIAGTCLLTSQLRHLRGKKTFANFAELVT